MCQGVKCFLFSRLAVCVTHLAVCLTHLAVCGTHLAVCLGGLSDCLQTPNTLLRGDMSIWHVGLLCMNISIVQDSDTLNQVESKKTHLT